MHGGTKALFGLLLHRVVGGHGLLSRSFLFSGAESHQEPSCNETLLVSSERYNQFGNERRMSAMGLYSAFTFTPFH